MSEQKGALATLAEQKLAAANERMEFVQGMGSGWEKLPDSMKKALEFYEMLAICKEQVKLLVKIPHKGNSGEPDWYMSPEQAMVHAMRCFKLGLDVFSGQVWFKPDTWTTTATLEGKQTLAAQRSNIGTPNLSEIKRPWAKGYAVPAALKSYEQEPGLRCTIQVGNGQVVYDCWLTEWTTNKALWVSKPMHMLGVRAREKALGIALGVGSSDMPDEHEIVAEALPEFSSMPTKRVEFIEQGKKAINVARAGGMEQLDHEDLEPILQASLDATKK